jgi:hypothetical protein
MDSKEPMISAPSVLSKVRERDLTWTTNDPTELDIACRAVNFYGPCFRRNRTESKERSDSSVKFLGVPGTTFDCGRHGYIPSKARASDINISRFINI